MAQPVYGFSSKRTAENLSSIGRQQPPSQWGQPPTIAEGRSWIVETPAAGVPKANVVGGITVATKTKCFAKYINEANGVVDYLKPFGARPPMELEVYNYERIDIEGERLMLAVQCGGRPVFVVSRPTPWIRFTSTSQMENETIRVRIDLINGVIEDPENPGFDLAVGDSANVYDPNNLFQNAQPNGTGIAYLRTPINSANNPPEGPPPLGTPRLEIEHISLPVDRIKCRLRDCLLYGTSTVTVEFGLSVGLHDWVHSDYPNVDMPPEAVEESVDQWRIENVENPLHLVATNDVNDVDPIITIVRRTDREPSEPSDSDVDPRPKTTVFWEIESIGDQIQIARWVRLVKTGSSWFYSAHWEGSNPTACLGNPVPAVCAFDCSCLDDGDMAIGFFAPELGQYQLISTEAALAGSLTSVTIVESIAVDGCSITGATKSAKVPCVTGGGSTGGSLPTGTVVTGVALYSNGTEICASVTTAVAVICGGGGTSFSCVDLCPIICQCPGWWDDPNCVPDPPDCNCEDCFFATGVTAVSVDDGTDTWSSSTIIGNVSDPCCWSAQFDDRMGGVFYLEACYAGNGDWTLTGATPNTAVSMAGNRDCTGADVSGTGGTGTITADGVPCTPPSGDCCPTWSGDEVASTYTASGDGIPNPIDITIDGQPPITAGGPCGAQFSGTVTITDSVTAETCNAAITGELRYFPDVPQPGDGSCMWVIEIAACDIFGGGVSTHESCLGADCGDVPGDCGDFLIADFRVGDPDASVTLECNDPTPAAALLSASGETLARIPMASTGPGRLGDQFARENPQFVKGCKCKRDIVAVMNRWTRGNVTEAQIDRLAGTIHAKNGEHHTLEEITKLLTEFVDDKN